jgi:hypothetical protein
MKPRKIKLTKKEQAEATKFKNEVSRWCNNFYRELNSSLERRKSELTSVVNYTDLPKKLREESFIRLDEVNGFIDYLEMKVDKASLKVKKK